MDLWQRSHGNTPHYRQKYTSKMRDNGEIEFSKINDRTILYNRFSIEEFIEMYRPENALHKVNVLEERVFLN